MCGGGGGGGGGGGNCLTQRTQKPAIFQWCNRWKKKQTTTTKNVGFGRQPPEC